jgi:hypothetical protein
VLVLSSGCRLLAGSVPCEADSNCPEGDVCDRQLCVAPGAIQPPGVPPRDDAGELAVDGGAPATDGGAGVEDAGAQGDAGQTATDAGSQPDDAGDTGPGADAGTADAGAPPPGATPPDVGTPKPPRCGSVALMSDDFDDGTRARHWSWSWNDNDAPMTETSGAAQQSFAVSLAGNNYSGYYSSLATTLRDSAIRIEVAQFPEMSAPLDFWFGLSLDNNYNELYFDAYQGGTLEMEAWVDGVQGTATVPLDQVAMRWWQLRESGGTLFFETSPDGQSWTTQHQIATPWFIDGAWLHFGGGTWDSHASPGTLRLDNLSSPEDSPGFCPAASEADDFADGIIEPGWRIDNDQGCNLDESGGHLSLTREGDAAFECGLYRMSAMSLVGSSISVHVVEKPGAPSVALTGLAAWSDWAWLEFAFVGDRLEAGVWYSGGPAWTPWLDMDAGAYEWLGTRERSGRLSLLASVDGVTWDELLQVDTPPFLDAVYPGLIFDDGNARTGATGERVVFDDWNRR